MSGSFKFFTKIMNGLSALDAVSTILKPVEMANIEEITYYVVFSVGVSAGAVQAETSHDPLYTGVWSPEGSPVGFVSGGAKHLMISGVTNARRLRISTGLVGGTVSAWVMGR